MGKDGGGKAIQKGMSQSSWGKGKWVDKGSWGKGTGVDNGWWGKGQGGNKGVGKDVGKGGGKDAGKDSAALSEDVAHLAAVDDLMKHTDLRSSDLVPKARQYLDALNAAGKLGEACAFLKTNLHGIPRDRVNNWRAYLFTLLRKYDPTFYESKKGQWNTHQRDPAFYESLKEQRKELNKEKKEKGHKKENQWKLNTDAPVFVPGKAWMSPKLAPAALTLDGCALNLSNELEALSFECNKAASPSHAAAESAKEDHRMMRAVHVAHEACEKGESSPTSVDAEGRVHGGSPSMAASKDGGVDRLKMFHRKRQSRTMSDDQSTVASIDGDGTIHGQSVIDRSPLITPASPQAIA